MLKVRVLPPSFDTEYARNVGEPTFCDEWDHTAESRSEKTCSGTPEIEIERRTYGNLKWRAVLCREHAEYLRQQLVESIELVDAGDLMRWSGK